LLEERDIDHAELLAAHPLVREHFGRQLRRELPDAWREGHRRLYEYYRNKAEELPHTVKDMLPLYSAVYHGCQADCHQRALDEVYRPRIIRWGELFSTRRLGAFSSELSALAGFFRQPWSEPEAVLIPTDKAFVLNQAGFVLWAIGRLTEGGG